MLQKAINVENKIGLRSSVIVWDAESYCFKSYCLFHNTFAKVQIKSLTAKKSKSEESKSRKSKLANKNFFAPPHINKPAKLIYQAKEKNIKKKARPEKLYSSNKKQYN